MKKIIPVLCLIAIGYSCQTEKTSTPPEIVQPIQWIKLTAAEDAKHIVLISGDEEYRSEEALPQMAKILHEQHGFNCTVLFAQNPQNPGQIDPNYTDNIPGLDQLEKADLMVIFTRFRALPDSQMQAIDDYLMNGRPVLGIRTATHAFNFKDSTNTWRHYGNYYEKPGDPWDGGFGRLVLGERWHTHHGHHKHQSTLGLIDDQAKDHPITNGLQGTSIWGSTDVYGVRLPLPGDAQTIILGQVMDRNGTYSESELHYGMNEQDSLIAQVNPATETPYNPNDPMMPIAWTKSYQLPDGQVGKSFTSTIGSSSDLTNEGVRRLLVNACYYLMDLTVPESASVDIVGDYQPSQYQFHDDEYWHNKGLTVEATR